MADLLDRASGWLDDMRTRHASRQVTYQRGGQSVQVAAGIGRTVFQIDNGSGVLETFESRDFLILAADLVLGGVAILPKAGDRITEGQDGTSYIYEVLAPGTEPAWRYSDPYRKTLRIHTKQIGTETT
ncbi:MAG: hypothetical protein BIFFINMI_00333 [Phycisphaerae bacterium]|nr:hypothetical protein [Phycisphaerae bacterium]